MASPPTNKPEKAHDDRRLLLQREPVQRHRVLALAVRPSPNVCHLWEVLHHMRVTYELRDNIPVPWRLPRIPQGRR